MEQFVLTAVSHPRVLSVQFTSAPSCASASAGTPYNTSCISAMRLYHNTQVSPKMGPQYRAERRHSWTVHPRQVTESQQQQDDDLIKPRKVPNPVRASHQHRALHRELLFCHRRGLLPRGKSELQCVLEHKRREQHKQRELALSPPSDLEVKLRTRQERIQHYELEEKRRSERLQNLPEFVRVRGALRRTQTFSL